MTTQYDKPKRWQISVRGMMATITAFCMALGMFLWSRQNNQIAVGMLSVLVLCELIGGVVGWLNTGTARGFWSGICVAGFFATYVLITFGGGAGR